MSTRCGRSCSCGRRRRSSCVCRQRASCECRQRASYDCRQRCSCNCKQRCFCDCTPQKSFRRESIARTWESRKRDDSLTIWDRFKAGLAKVWHCMTASLYDEDPCQCGPKSPARRVSEKPSPKPSPEPSPKPSPKPTPNPTPVVEKESDNNDGIASRDGSLDEKPPPKEPEVRKVDADPDKTPNKEEDSTPSGPGILSRLWSLIKYLFSLLWQIPSTLFHFFKTALFTLWSFLPGLPWGKGADKDAESEKAPVVEDDKKSSPKAVKFKDRSVRKAKTPQTSETFLDCMMSGLKEWACDSFDDCSCMPDCSHVDTDEKMSVEDSSHRGRRYRDHEFDDETDEKISSMDDLYGRERGRHEKKSSMDDLYGRERGRHQESFHEGDKFDPATDKKISTMLNFYRKKRCRESFHGGDRFDFDTDEKLSPTNSWNSRGRPHERFNGGNRFDMAQAACQCQCRCPAIPQCSSDRVGAWAMDEAKQRMRDLSPQYSMCCCAPIIPRRRALSCGNMFPYRF